MFAAEVVASLYRYTNTMEIVEESIMIWYSATGYTGLQVTGNCGSVQVRLIPAPCGTGIVSPHLQEATTGKGG